VEKKAYTLPHLQGNVLACHAADLLLTQELSVRRAYQNRFRCDFKQKGQPPTLSSSAALADFAAGLRLCQKLTFRLVCH
jgi:hypothetical protein